MNTQLLEAPATASGPRISSISNQDRDNETETAILDDTNLERTPNLFSVSPQMHLQWGLALYGQGDTLAALWAFFESVGNEPENALGHYLCGLAFQALELRQEAQAEWEIVLKLTSQDEAVSPKIISGETSAFEETQWVRTLVQRLLDKEAGAVTPAREAPAFTDVLGIGPENAGPRTTRQEDLGRQGNMEQSILEDVRLYGNCYVKDRYIASRLMFSTEEQIVGWRQSFSTRAGLECHLYQKSVEQSDRHEGVIFTRRATSVE